MRLNLTVNKLKPPSGQAVQLSNFVSTYPNCLPLCIQVQNGFCSSTSDLSISQNEHLNLHFIKHTKVITLRDCKEGKNTFSVPLNSAVDFALLYDPYRDEEQALQGYCFETVAELMALKSLPRVVRATKSYEGRTLETSVRADELLIVKGIRSGSFPGRTKTLEVYSMQYGKKFLSEKCMAFFSTRPSEVRITISTMSRFGLSFPQKVIILGDCEIMSRLPPCMTSTPVVLEGYRGETSVIATMANRDPSLHGKVSSFELFSDLDLQFQALTLAQGEQEQLSEMTSMLYRSFSASTHPMFMEKPTSRAYELQVLLYRKVTKPCQNDGIQLVWPLLLDEDTPKSDASDIVFSDMEVASSTSRESGAQTRSWQEGGRAVELPFPYRHSLSPLSLAPPNQVEKKVTDNESTNEAVYQVIGMTRQEMKENEYIHEDEHREAVTDTTAVASVSQSQCNGDHGSPQLQDYDTLWGHVAHVTKRLNELTARVDKMANSIESLSRNASRTSFPNGIASTWQEIQEQFRELESSMQSSAHQPETQEQSRAAAAAEGSHKMEPLCAENRETLAAMDCNQVGSFHARYLLKNMVVHANQIGSTAILETV